MDLNHTIVPAIDRVASQQWFARMMGLKCEALTSNFAPVRVNDTLVLDFLDRADPPHHHYAFHVSDQEFDEIFARVQAEGLIYGSGPHETRHDMQVSNRHGGRGVYFDDPNGHSIELLTAL